MGRYAVSTPVDTESLPMSHSKFHDRFVRVKPDVALAAQSLRPTSALTKITTEALLEWIERRQHDAELLARAKVEESSR